MIAKILISEAFGKSSANHYFLVLRVKISFPNFAPMISAARSYLIPLVALCISVGVPSAPLLAAESEKIDSIWDQLPELNIMALKQQERLRAEAISTSTLTGEDLSRSGAVAVKGISEMVPNLYIPDYGSRITSSVYMRGLGARMDHPAVGLTVDNVAVINKDAYDLDIPDMERVEVLRGPQSALYGRNTMGGMINVTTLSPMRYQGLRAAATLGNGRTVRASAGWYGKFNSRNALSTSVAFNRQGGFRRNEFNGHLTENETSGSLRLKYAWRPNESVFLQNVASASLLHQDGYAYEFIETGRIDYNDPSRYNRFTFSDGLTFKRFHHHFTVVSVTSLQYIKDDLLLDQDFLPQDYFTLNQRKHEIAVTQDLMMRSPEQNKSAYSWLVGVSGFWKRMDMDAPVVFKNAGISQLIEGNRNKYNYRYPIAWDSREFPLNSEFTIPTWGFDAYHESKLRLGDFSIKGAIRIEYERAALDYHSQASSSYGIYDNSSGQTLKDPAQIASFPLVRRVYINIDDYGKLTRDYMMLLPSLSMMWNIDGGLSNIYLAAARGAKAGGFNTQMFSEVLQQRVMSVMGVGNLGDIAATVGYKPEHSWMYEVGTHVDIPGADLQIDGAMFYIDCRDQQLTMFPEGSTTGRMMTNAGRTRSMGAEATLRWTPCKGLDLNASYGFTDAKFRRFYDGREDFSGKYLPYVPRNTLFIQAIKEFSLESMKESRIVIDINMRMTGPIDWNEANTLRQKTYAQLGASLTWVKKLWSLMLWGKNLTDTRFHTFYFKSMGHEFLQQGKPIQFGATISIQTNI